MKWFAGIAFATSLIVMPAVALTENAPIDTKADVQKLAAQWMDAYNKKDAATIAKMYTDDALVSFDQWTACGSAALQDAFNKEFPADTKFTAITVDQSQRIGDLNIARGTWAAAPPSNSKTASRSSKYRLTTPPDRARHPISRIARGG